MTNIERLILINQYQLKVALGADDPLDDLRIEILTNGYRGDYDQYIFSEFEQELTPEKCDYVQNVLHLVKLLQKFNPKYEFHGFSKRRPHEAKYAVHLRSRHLYTDVICINDDFLSGDNEQYSELLGKFNTFNIVSGELTKDQYDFITGE